MGRKSILDPYKVIDNGDAADAEIQSLITNVEKVDSFTYVVEWSGSSIVGEVSVRVRQVAPFRASEIFTTEWVTLDFGTSIAITGNAGNHTITVRNFGFTEAQLVYTNDSGTGTIDATIAGLVTGA